MSVEKRKRLRDLHMSWEDCRRCGLCETRKRIVFGSGNPDAKLLIVGEAPGAEEDACGQPFVGEAGNVLDTFLSAVRIDRDADTYITNTVCCRPFFKDVNEATGRAFEENRPPSTEERAACKDRLLKLIYIIDPFLIVALGKSSLASLLGRTNVVSKMRGHVFNMRLRGKQTEIKYPVAALYHPAFLLRNLDYASESGIWQQTGRDWKMVAKVIEYINLKYYGITGEEHGQEDDTDTETEE